MTEFVSNNQTENPDLVARSVLSHLKRSGLKYFYSECTQTRCKDLESLAENNELSNNPVNEVFPGSEVIETSGEIICKRCQKQQTAENRFIVGFGNSDSPAIMFIWEAPFEFTEGNPQPFEDPAGKLLAGAIVKGLKIKLEDVYLCNIFKCESVNKDGEQEKGLASSCREVLFKQIKLVRPKVIICLGGTAQLAISGIDKGITKLRGEWQSWNEIPVMPTIHPNYIVHNPSAKRDLWEDLKKVMEKLGMS